MPLEAIAITDTLQAEVERRMQPLIIPYQAGGGPVIAYVEAVAVTVEMIEEERKRGLPEGLMDALSDHRAWHIDGPKWKQRAEAAEMERDEARKALAEHREKWGHVERCHCRTRDIDALMKREHDPRCAPAPEEKA